MLVKAETPAEAKPLNFHCNRHHVALKFGADSLRLVSRGVAELLCPGSIGAADPHQIELDLEFIPFRVDVARSVSDKSEQVPAEIT